MHQHSKCWTSYHQHGCTPNLIVNFSKDCSANVHYILCPQLLIGDLGRREEWREGKNGIRRNLNSKVCSHQSMQATEDMWHYHRSVLQSVTVEHSQIMDCKGGQVCISASQLYFLLGNFPGLAQLLLLAVRKNGRRSGIFSHVGGYSTFAQTFIWEQCV